MQILKPLAAAAFITGLVAAAALPASAAETDTTFEVTGGSLALAVEAEAGLTDETSDGIGENTITGSLGLVSVTDNRGGTTGWTTTAASSTFIHPTSSASTSTRVAYTNGEVTEFGTSTVAPVSDEALTITPVPVASATAVVGNNTASWSPTLDVTLPAGALIGVYTGTVTTSLS